MVSHMHPDISLDGSSLPAGVQFEYSGELKIQSVLASDWYGGQLDMPVTALPQIFVLHEPHPNPFNPVTNIEFMILDQKPVSLRIYDNLGKEVAVLAHESLPPGSYQMEWNASHLPSGIYFVRMEAEGFSQSQKLLLLK